MGYDLYEVPDGIEPLIGYRGWMVRYGKLLSCYREVEWPIAGPVTSECIMPTYRTMNDRGNSLPPPPKHYISPDISCSCGVYALHEYPDVWELREGERRVTMKPWPLEAVTGIVKAWGKIIVGTKGFRAQYVEPIALVAKSRYATIEQLAEAYGLQVVRPQEVRKT